MAALDGRGVLVRPLDLGSVAAAGSAGEVEHGIDASMVDIKKQLCTRLVAEQVDDFNTVWAKQHGDAHAEVPTKANKDFEKGLLKRIHKIDADQPCKKLFNPAYLPVAEYQPKHLEKGILPLYFKIHSVLFLQG